MKILGTRDLEATRKKLRLLEEHYRARLQDKTDRSHARDLSLQSLKRMMNQLTEEIARYEAHVAKR